MQILLVFALLIAFLAIIFAVYNTDVVTISFLLWKTEGSLALILFIALVAGALISYLATTPSQLRRRMTISNQRKQIKDLEGQLSDSKAELAQLNEKLTQAEEKKQAEETSTTDAETPPTVDEDVDK